MTKFEWIIVALVTGMFVISVMRQIDVSRIRVRIEHLDNSCDSIRNNVGCIDTYTDNMWQDVLRIRSGVTTISKEMEHANRGDDAGGIDIDKVLTGKATHILKGLSATKEGERYCCLRCPCTSARECKSVLDDDIRELQRIVDRANRG